MLFVIFGAVYFIRNSGYNPKPILVMKVSQYNNFSDLGKSLYKRFYLEAKNIQHFIVLCDYKSCEQKKIWQSFVSEINANQLKARKYFSFVEKNLDENKLNNYLNLINTSDDFSLAILPLSLESQIKGNKQNQIYFTMTPFYVNKAQERGVDKCNDKNNLENLKCLSLGYSRRFYRKKFDPKNKHVGMEKNSSNKYLLYLN